MFPLVVWTDKGENMLFEILKGRKVLKRTDDVVPNSHSVWEKTILKSISATSDFMEYIRKVNNNVSIWG